jgi:hypothetical protein
MQATDKPTTDDDDEGRWRMRKVSTLKKAKNKKLKGGAKKLDARQYAMLGGVIFLTGWGLAVTFLLLNLGIMYNFTTVPETREDYSVKGAAEWAKRQASEDLMQGVEIWNIINASLTGLVYRSPADYTNLGNVLSPVFDTMSTLHSIEFGFSDRASQVSLTRRKGTEGTVLRGPSSVMQATSTDCFLMGVEGCVAQPLTMALDIAPRPYWYTHGMYSLRPTPYGGSFSWWNEPELVVEKSDDGGDLLWPVIRLVFKVSFPTFRDASGANTVVVGRITIKLAGLGGSRLADKRLGDDGKILLVDAGGITLASQDVYDVLGVSEGRARFKSFREVGGAWTSAVNGAFPSEAEPDDTFRRRLSAENPVTRMKKEADGTFVAVEPLAYPLERFAIIVVAPSREPFQNVALVGTSALASVVAPAPYAITGVIAAVFVVIQCAQTIRANDGKVGFATAKKPHSRDSRHRRSTTTSRLSQIQSRLSGIVFFKSRGSTA